MTEQQQEKVWGTSELAREAKVTATYVRQLLVEGRLDGYKLGRDWFVSDEEAQRWLANRRTKTKSS
jgi:excisionase family DNA binding protein